MASRGPEGRGTTCNVGSSSFGATDVVAVGECGLSSGPVLKE